MEAMEMIQRRRLHSSGQRKLWWPIRGDFLLLNQVGQRTSRHIPRVKTWNHTSNARRTFPTQISHVQDTYKLSNCFHFNSGFLREPELSGCHTLFCTCAVIAILSLETFCRGTFTGGMLFLSTTESVRHRRNSHINTQTLSLNSLLSRTTSINQHQKAILNFSKSRNDGAAVAPAVHILYTKMHLPLDGLSASDILLTAYVTLLLRFHFQTKQITTSTDQGRRLVTTNLTCYFH